MDLEAVARKILSLVAHQHPRDGSWWGNDTDCGSDAEVIAAAVAILKEWEEQDTAVDVLVLSTGETVTVSGHQPDKQPPPLDYGPGYWGPYN